MHPSPGWPEISVHFKDSKFYCDEREFSSKNNKGLKKRTEKGHEPKECDIGRKIFTSEKDQSDHVNRNHDNNSYNNSTCA